MGAVKTLVTFEEFERMDEKPGKQELIRGELVELPPPELPHHKVLRRLFLALNAAVEAAQHLGQARDLGVTYPEMGYKFPEGSWLQPDISVTYAGQVEENIWKARQPLRSRCYSRLATRGG